MLVALALEPRCQVQMIFKGIMLDFWNDMGEGMRSSRHSISATPLQKLGKFERLKLSDHPPISGVFSWKEILCSYFSKCNLCQIHDFRVFILTSLKYSWTSSHPYHNVRVLFFKYEPNLPSAPSPSMNPHPSSKFFCILIHVSSLHPLALVLLQLPVLLVSGYLAPLLGSLSLPTHLLIGHSLNSSVTPFEGAVYFLQRPWLAQKDYFEKKKKEKTVAFPDSKLCYLNSVI